MNVLQLRVVDKSGAVLGTVDTLSIWKGEVMYTKYDKFGCSNEKTQIAKFPCDVDIQCSLNGQNWQAVSVPAVDDSDLKFMAKTLKGA